MQVQKYQGQIAMLLVTAAHLIPEDHLTVVRQAAPAVMQHLLRRFVHYPGFRLLHLHHQNAQPTREVLHCHPIPIL